MEFFETYTVGKIFLCLVVSGVFIKICWEVFTWIVDKLNLYHSKKKLSEVLDERINTLEKHDVRQYEQINDVSKVMMEIQDTLAIMKKENDERTVGTYRTELYRLYKEFKCQGYVTIEGLKTFTESGKIYEKAGGDDIYHSRLHPEVMALEIREAPFDEECK